MQQNNYNNNSVKSKLDSSYLIVGIDIGKYNQYARITDFEGNELGKKVIFSRDKLGLNKLLLTINTTKVQYSKSKVLIVMEPTGIYWSNIYNYFNELDESIKVAVVDVADVINIRRLFYRSVKSDTIDCLAIARTAAFKGFKQRLELSEDEQNIKDLVSFKERLTKDFVMLKNKITGHLDEIFPEYKKVYSDYFCKESMAILSVFFYPQKINDTKLEVLAEEVNKAAKRKVNSKRLIKLKDIAAESIGVNPSFGKQEEFKYNLKRLNDLINKIKEIEIEVTKLMQDNSMFKAMIEIDGMNTVSAANLLSVIGDFTKFKSSKQLLSYCGLNLKINESGTHKGKTSISKNGNSIMRAYLFRVMLPMVKFNNEFKELHNYYKTRENNPLTPMQSLTALMCKLLRILWGMAKGASQYDSSKAFKQAITKVA